MTRTINLSVNDVPVDLDYFVQGFIDHTVNGMVSGLEGVHEVKSVEITLDGNKLAVNINNAPLSLNEFVSKVVRNTLVGMVSSLKGVTEVKKLKIAISGTQSPKHHAR
ncbi:MAG: hypothetical protein HY670_02115 [Chloroflexi bacterium]|nr:hypothetical protein [Chloroflexota bacterium]